MTRNTTGRRSALPALTQCPAPRQTDAVAHIRIPTALPNALADTGRIRIGAGLGTKPSKG